MFDRRSLLQLLSGAAVSGTALAKMEPIKTVQIKVSDLPAPPLVEHTLAHAIVKLATASVASVLRGQQVRVAARVPRFEKPGLHDWVTSGRRLARMDHLLEASFKIRDVLTLVTNPEILDAYCAPAAIAIAERMREDAKLGDLIAATPPPFPEWPTTPTTFGRMLDTVADVEVRYREDGRSFISRFPVMVGMAHDEEDPGQLFIVSTFYGILKG